MKRRECADPGGLAVTDLTTHDEADATSASAAPASEAATVAIAAPGAAATEPLVQWAPAEPTPRKSRRALWIGIPAAAAVIGLAAASLVLIAPGTAVAGVPVGLLTPGAATDAINARLAGTEVTIGEGGPTLTGAELGASVDAAALAGAAFEERPAWNLSQWFGEADAAEVTLDPATATAALQAAAPELFTAPVDAQVAFDGKTYAVTPDTAGVGVDLSVLEDAVGQAFAAGQTAVTITPSSSPVEAATTTAKAEGAAATLNAMLDDIGFYVGDERTVPVAADVAADWLTVTTDEAGDFQIAADAAKIQTAVDTLKEKVDQDAVDGDVITNASGTVLETRTAGQDGRVLGDTSGIANDFAAQLATGDGVYELPVQVTPHKTAEVAYLLEVDLSEQRLYAKENGKTVMTWLISSGKDETPTHTGRYTIGWRTPSQTMTSEKYGYSVPNVAWVMYFNGDQGFHGAYWHNNFGHQMSHGCVNMPDWRAKVIYDWAPTGTDVWIHA